MIQTRRAYNFIQHILPTILRENAPTTSHSSYRGYDTPIGLRPQKKVDITQQTHFWFTTALVLKWQVSNMWPCPELHQQMLYSPPVQGIQDIHHPGRDCETASIKKRLPCNLMIVSIWDNIDKNRECSPNICIKHSTHFRTWMCAFRW